VTLLLASNGLGVLETVTVDRANFIMKGYYASELLYISAMCFAKLSILVLFYNVVALMPHRFVVLGFGIFIFAWSAASAIATAFQCSMPQPWEMLTLRCFDTRTFWVVYCVIDITTEIAIITLSIDLVAHLKVRLSRKIAVVACFVPRLLVIFSAIVRAFYFYQISPHADPVYDLWISTVCTQVHVCASICTACIPYMVPFFKSLQGNIWRSYSTKSWNMVARSSKLPRHASNRLQKREAMSYILPKVPDQATDRVSRVPPYIPSPEPLSPFMPPPNVTYLHPNKVASSISIAPNRSSYEASIRGTSVSGTLYDSDSDFFDMREEEESLDFSDSRLYGDSPLLGNHFMSKQPTKPLPAYSPALSSSVYSGSAPPSPIPTPHSPLLQNRRETSIFPDYPDPRMNRQTMPNTTSQALESFACPTRSASTTHPNFSHPNFSRPKFSTTPRLYSSSTTIPPLPQI
jgi:hypothetical protein